MIRRAARFWMILALCLGAAQAAWAHKASDSYLAISVGPDGTRGQWDIALRDLDYALGLDADENGEITWGELRAKHGEIAAYALSRLALKADGKDCVLALTQHLVDEHSDGAYAVLRFDAACPPVPRTLDISYRLFFDIDPQHRGLLRLETGGEKPLTMTTIFSPESPQKSFQLGGEGGTFHQFLVYIKEGIWHIWTGFDHVLFLVSLLLPAVLVLRGAQWEPAPRFGGAFIEVLKIVTAFTLAHSITLSLAALEVVSLPSRFVESMIALSVVLAALNNLYPVVRGKRWVGAFGFGLIHGFGFASVLVDLGLPQWALLAALVGFNLGVEIGQAVLVSVILPATFAMRGTRFYRRVVFTGGSWLIVLVAAVWFAERAFNLRVIS